MSAELFGCYAKGLQILLVQKVCQMKYLLKEQV